MPHPVIESAQRFRGAALRRERATANALVRAYGRAYQNMQTEVEALQAEISRLEDPHRSQVVRLNALRSLQRQTMDEINAFAIYADQQILDAALAEIPQALRDGRSTVAAYFRSPVTLEALNAQWDMLAAEQVETMLGFVGNDSPLRQALVNRLGPTVAERMADNLVDAIVLGMNPRQTADIVRRELGVGLTWALNTARTAQLYTYREATRAGYVANRDIVSSWTWFAELDSRVCLSCVNKHGETFPVTETLNDHHSGRCTMLPEVPLAKRLGVDLPEVQPGETWFRAQSAETQRSMMGPAMHDAWRKKEFAFEDLSRPYEDPVYGEMLREASLRGILGRKAETYYTQGRRQ